MNYDNKPSNYYSSIRFDMLKFLPNNAKTILEVGCGNGAFAQEIMNSREAEIWGIEMMEEPANEAKQKMHKVFIGECEKFIDDLPDNYFDVIYFNDVLEHIFDPGDVLKKIKQKLKSNGVVISSIPNARFYRTLKMYVFEKDWKYEDSGIMDFTHIKFYTKKSIKRLYEDAGYRVKTNEGINKTSSLTPYIYNLFFLFRQMDIFIYNMPL